MKRLELRLVKQSTYRGILHPRDYMAEFETPLQVGQGLLTTAYICAIEFRILPNFEKLYMKKKKWFKLLSNLLLSQQKKLLSNSMLKNK